MVWTPEDDQLTKAERWLREHGRRRATAKALAILDRCIRGAELEFAATLLELPGWIVDADGLSFTNDIVTLTPRASIGEYKVSFLIKHRRDGELWAFDILDDVAPERKRVVDPKREGFIRERVAQYKIITVSQAGAAAKTMCDGFRALDQQVGHTNLHHYRQLLAPALVWRPLSDRFIIGATDNVEGTARAQRLYYWLQDHFINLPVEAVYFASHTDWYGAVLFLVPILQLGLWKYRGLKAVNGSIGVELQRNVGGVQVEFTIGRLESRTRKPTVVEFRRPPGAAANHETRRQIREQRVKTAGYPYLPVEASDAAEQGRFWAGALQSAIVQRDEMIDRLDEGPEDGRGPDAPPPA